MNARTEPARSSYGETTFGHTRIALALSFSTLITNQDLHIVLDYMTKDLTKCVDDSVTTVYSEYAPSLANATSYDNKVRLECATL